jgi:peptide chain release factor 3
VGALQFDVLKDRIKNEYNIPVRFESAPYAAAHWVQAQNAKELEKFLDLHKGNYATDHLDNPVFLSRSAWDTTKLARDYPDIILKKHIDI